MPRYIYGYVAKSLADIGNLDTRLVIGGENPTMRNFDNAWNEVKQRVASVPLEEQEWRGAIGIREGNDKTDEPVIVLGNVYEQGEQLPEIPEALTHLFPGQEPVSLPLRYQG
ncbi:hypothetical protein NM208_g8571 [Fusarium decemcellulare]|uniref:Uncharacterized protein n=1 Tax=Fusarium decemcellulare TaxID=57161 RepID=A0ACC1S4X4_9HYPO|nr:hypothetical protein NM208_g8571 [Fusarium decemcellulare]